eukprot:TRINITY_DN21792_c0_g1_i1.p1 TRINITY_DN21792_c0_g1~~TRINITY_DN21792_c0_g1_i1.p1  ORF type:complete len:498 (+),score=67.94 TRINITY_DN21792_c0_g1_i1:69-1562(+)
MKCTESLDHLIEIPEAVFLAVLSVCLLSWLSWHLSGLNTSQNAVLITGSQESSHMRRRAAKHVAALDGLRVIFINLVIMYHFFWLPRVGGEKDQLHFIPHNSMSFFMVLSGFLRYQQLDRQAADFDRRAFGHYVARILVRFGPAYWSALTALFCCRLWQQRLGSPLAWPLEAAFLQSLLSFRSPMCRDDALFFCGNMGAWFTSCVVICSVLTPALYVRRPRNGLVPVLAALVALHVVSILLLPSLLLDTCLFFVLHITDRSVVYRIVEFSIGMLTAQLHNELREIGLTHWIGWGWIFDAVLAAVVGLQISVVVFNLSDEAPAACICFKLLMPLLMISAQSAVEGSDDSRPASGRLGHLCAQWHIVALAEISFGAYIYQFAVHKGLKVLAQVLAPSSDLHWLWANLLTLPLTWLLAAVSHKFMEQPLRRVLEARIESTRTDKELVESPARTIQVTESPPRGSRSSPQARKALRDCPMIPRGMSQELLLVADSDTSHHL